MDYFSKKQAIALPLTSEKVLPFTANDDALTSDPSSSPASKMAKFNKVMKILVYLFFLGALFGHQVVHKILYKYHDFFAVGIRIPDRGPQTDLRHSYAHYNHRLNRNQDPPMGLLGPVFDSSVVESPHRRCDTNLRWSDPEQILNDDRFYTGPRFSSNATFSFSLSSESLMLYARGDYATGRVIFVDDDTTSGDIVIDLNVRYWNQEDLYQAQICTLHYMLGQPGLGIFTPMGFDHGLMRDELVFTIFVRFPKSHDDDNPVHVKNFKTFLTKFAHEFPKANIHFDALTVMTSLFPISAESLSVKSGKLYTRNNAIVGNYTVTDYLELRTTDGPLFANVTMNNAGAGSPTRLSVSSIGAPVYANVSLFSNEAMGGEFIINAVNYNAPLHVEFPTAPVDHILYLSASSSDVWVDLPHTYEGAFILGSSSPSRPHMTVAEGVEDPKGEGRSRQITFDNAGHRITGNVSWTGEGKEGSVEILSRMLDAYLGL